MIESTWDAVIAEADELPVDAYVCFTGPPRRGTEQVVLAREDDWQDDDDAVPAAAGSLGMTSCLTKGELVQVLDNLGQQDPTARPELARRAVAHYLQYDAFLELASDHRAESS